MPQKQIAGPTASKSNPAIYSLPCNKEEKEFVLNESVRTGLTQKELVKRAFDALKKGPRIPNAMPIKLQ